MDIVRASHRGAEHHCLGKRLVYAAPCHEGASQILLFALFCKLWQPALATCGKANICSEDLH